MWFHSRRSCPPSCLALLLFMLVAINMIASVASLVARSSSTSGNIIRISEHVWRQAALQHRERIRELVEPGLISIQEHNYKGGARHRRDNHSGDENGDFTWITSLDPKNPIYNFLIEYYGLKGMKGVRRLIRWSPCPSLLLQKDLECIQTLDELEKTATGISTSTAEVSAVDKESQSQYSQQKAGILLEGATDDDFGNILHLRGATIVNGNDDGNLSVGDGAGPGGVLYSPSLFYGKYDDSSGNDDAARLATPFLWYRSILQQTLNAEPILHCFGLHGKLNISDLLN